MPLPRNLRLLILEDRDQELRIERQHNKLKLRTRKGTIHLELASDELAIRFMKIIYESLSDSGWVNPATRRMLDHISPKETQREQYVRTEKIDI